MLSESLLLWICVGCSAVNLILTISLIAALFKVTSSDIPYEMGKLVSARIAEETQNAANRFAATAGSSAVRRVASMAASVTADDLDGARQTLNRYANLAASATAGSPPNY